MSTDNDVKELMQDYYLQYASYVILDRAIPNVIDGLKPVQRRILHTLSKIDDGKLHKVANVAGQTMAYHPHGDAAIIDALVNMASKDYLLDRQGNFGNLYTGDPAAAARYIETRLSSLAKETMFNPDLTHFISSYDGRNLEPICLPAKIPVLLLHGAEGIAVGMSTRILPHNFCELLEAEIAILEEKEFEIYPDFLTGGILDTSEYDRGRGKVKLRAKLTLRDDKTLVIEEICFGTTTESLMRSIEEAAKRGKIKIDSIHDYTAEKVEIEIKLPRGQYAQELKDALYAFTECEVSLSSQILVIHNNLPWETDVHEVLKLHVQTLKDYLRRELEIERDRLTVKIFEKSLEQLFIENRLYKKIEEVRQLEKIHETIEKSLTPFHPQLIRIPTHEDREKLLSIPIRRISRFDIEKNQQEIKTMQEQIEQIEKNLKSLKRYTISYLKELLKTYADLYPRRTKLSRIKEVDVRAVDTRTLRIGFDADAGFIGTKVSSEVYFECTPYDKILLIYQDGTYKVVNIPEKLYANEAGKQIAYAAVADKKSVFRCIYRDTKSHFCYAKRFIVDAFILDKIYTYLPEDCKLELLTTADHPVAQLEFKPKPKQKQSLLDFAIDDVAIKGVKAKGVRIASKEVKKVKLVKK